MASALLEALSGAPTGDASAKFSGSNVDYPEVLARLGELWVPFVSGLRSVATSTATADDLAAVVEICEEAAAIRARLQSAPLRRPWVLTAKRTRAQAEGLVQVMRRFVCAFGARTLLEAQQVADTAQAELDALVAAADDLTGLLTRWNDVSDEGDVADPLTALAADAFTSASAADVVGLDDEGRRAYCEITGRMPPVGAGALLQMQRLWVTVLGDEDRYRDCLRAADAILLRERATFDEVLRRPAALSELRNGWLQLADQMAATHATVAAAVNDRQIARSALQLLHTAFEGPARRFASLFLELVGKGTFEGRLGEDGSQVLLLTAQDKRLRQLFYGLNKSLRIAYAHQSFRVEDDAVVLRDTRGVETTVTADELLNHLLAAEECLAGVGLALHVAAQDHGWELLGDEHLAALGLSASDVLAASLGLGGMTEAAVHLQGTTATVDAVTSRMTAGHIGMLCGLLPDCRSAVIRLRRPGRHTPQVWTVDLESFRRHTAIPEGIEKEISFLDAIAQTSVDGSAALSDAAVAHWVAVRAMIAAAEGYPAALASLRSLLTFARDRGHAALAASLRDVMRFIRLCGTGAANEADSEAIDALRRFVLEQPPPMPFTDNGSSLNAA